LFMHSVVLFLYVPFAISCNCRSFQWPSIVLYATYKDWVSWDELYKFRILILHPSSGGIFVPSLSVGKDSLRKDENWFDAVTVYSRGYWISFSRPRDVKPRESNSIFDFLSQLRYL
jgi:hypothetical protein